MQECEKMQDRMLAYFDGKLDADQTRALKRHLETCAQCRSLFEGMEALMKAEKALPKDTPAGLHEQIMAAVRWDARLTRLRTRSRRKAWVAAACACLVLVGAGTLSLLRMGAGATKSACDENGSGYASDMAAPESVESASQDSVFEGAYDDADMPDGSAPEEDEDTDASNNVGASGDEMKSEPENLPDETLDAILASLQIEAAEVDPAVCTAQDLAALEAASGVQALEAEGYQTLLLDAQTFDAMLAQGLLSAAGESRPDGGSAARVLVILLVE